MSKFNDAGELAALRTTIFQTIQDWNTAHPQRLPSHRECAAINITQTYTDAGETTKYAIAIECQLAGRATLTFHGRDLGEIAEQARLIIERRLAVEIQLREDNAREIEEIVRKYGTVN